MMFQTREFNLKSGVRHFQFPNYKIKYEECGAIWCALNLTQRELSKISGIKQPSIAKIESGKRWPQVNTLQKAIIFDGLYIKSSST